MSFSNEQIEILRQRVEKRNELLSPYASKDSQAIRKEDGKQSETVYRTPYIVDVDRIIHNLFYNRYVDKTQVFSLYKNDDITRRGSHVQLVSRIARTIGAALGLNLDLIEAISLGHDIGHTPFGHRGESYLNDCYYSHTGRLFNHNVHSVRVFSVLTRSNLTLQTLDGILCHNGELPMSHYEPKKLGTFNDFEQTLEKCYTERDFCHTLVPSTLEGCVVRISDIIAYLGKDRQDAIKVMGEDSPVYNKTNGEIIKMLTESIIANSLDKNYLSIDDDTFAMLKRLKEENYQYIYHNPKIDSVYKDNIRPMFSMLYEQFWTDLAERNEKSYIYKHHIEYAYIGKNYQDRGIDITDEKYFDDIVTDYIASMTDDYFIEVFSRLFPDAHYKINYISYFANGNQNNNKR